MIYDNIKKISRYTGSDEKLGFCLEKARELSPQTPDGRYDLAEGIFVNVSSYELAPKDGWTFEAHEKYADVQLILEGAEIIGVSSGDATETVAYDAEKDIKFFEGNAAPLKLEVGDFAVFYPDELHAPAHFAGVKNVKKAVFKIKFAE